jgi:hypothetical protein
MAGHVPGCSHGVMMSTELPSTFFTTAIRLGKLCSTTSVYCHTHAVGPTWASSTPAGNMP